MPNYDFLKSGKVDFARTGGKLSVLKTLGVPYSDSEILSAEAKARSQARLIVEDLKENAVEIEEDSEMVAMIAYLQRLGRGPQPTGEAEVAEGP